MQINWDDAPDWAQWLAVDGNGSAFWYTAKPFISGNNWGGGDSFAPATKYNLVGCADDSWKRCIWQREAITLVTPATVDPLASEVPAMPASPVLTPLVQQAARFGASVNQLEPAPVESEEVRELRAELDHVRRQLLAYQVAEAHEKMTRLGVEYEAARAEHLRLRMAANAIS